MSAHLGNERAARAGWQDGVVDKLAGVHVVICGAGAVGANLCEHLARIGVGRLTVVDRDRVEARNLATQPWTRTDVGQQKAPLLAKLLARAVSVDVNGVVKDVDAHNIGALVTDADVVVDAFDNAASRAVIKGCVGALKAGAAVVHVGLANGFAEVVWEPRYIVPPDTGADLCDVGLSRSMVLLAVAVAGEAIVEFVASGERRSFTLTGRDLRISPLQ